MRSDYDDLLLYAKMHALSIAILRLIRYLPNN